MASALKVSVALLTCNRLHLLRRTVESMTATPVSFDLVVIDGGSDSQEQLSYVASFPRSYFVNCKGTVGAAMNIAIELALETHPDVVVFTADDYWFSPDWLDRLTVFWCDAPEDVVIASLNWEPVYPWNTHIGDVFVGQERALIRKTIPGSSWSFRAANWPLIGPVADKTGGEDFEVCQRLQGSGYRLAALNLTQHIGERESAWGNQSWTIAKPLTL